MSQITRIDFAAHPQAVLDSLDSMRPAVMRYNHPASTTGEGYLDPKYPRIDQVLSNLKKIYNQTTQGR